MNIGPYAHCDCPRNAPPGPPSGPEWHCHGCGYWNPALGRDDRQGAPCRTCGATQPVSGLAVATFAGRYFPDIPACEHCGAPVRIVNFALGARAMHYDPDASYRDDEWWHCRLSIATLPSSKDCEKS